MWYLFKNVHIQTWIRIPHTACSFTKAYKCGTCGKEFAGKDHYLGHVNRHLLHKPYKCNHCGKTFYYNSNKSKHAKKCGGTKHFVCSICKSDFKTEIYLREHEAGAHGEDRYTCKCGKQYQWRGSFYRHKNKCLFTNK